MDKKETWYVVQVRTESPYALSCWCDTRKYMDYEGARLFAYKLSLDDDYCSVRVTKREIIDSTYMTFKDEHE